MPLFADRLSRLAVNFILCSTVIAVFVPFRPNMPAPGLDNSWAYGMNQAIAQGLVFGRDIIFTVGPYASVYTTVFHPATDGLMMLGSGCLGICSAVALLWLTRGAPLRWALALTVALAGFALQRDVLLLLYLLLLVLVVYRLTLPTCHGFHLARDFFTLPGLALIFFVSGLLPLIKLSLLPVSAAETVLSALFLMQGRQFTLAAIVVLAPLGGLLSFWMIAGQRLGDLPGFVLNTEPIISGYSEAMAYFGRSRELLLYCVASLSALCLAASAKAAPRSSRSFMVLSLGALLFLAFKEAFVRHDAHAVVAGTFIVVVAIALNFCVRARGSGLMLALALASWADIDQWHVESSTRSVIENVRGTYEYLVSGVYTRLNDDGALRRIYDERVRAIAAEYPVKALKGRTDVYFYGQSILLASGNQWSPRPVLQSYSAYTPKLASLDEQHLTGEQAPDNILFRVEAIDGRLPSAEDGPSWPTMINNYFPVEINSGFLYLSKKPAPATTPARLLISEQDYALGDSVVLPASTDLIFAQIDIRPTIAGQIAAFFYKLGPLEIEIELPDRVRKTYRIVSGMAKAGFLISPLVESTDDFARLFTGTTHLDQKVVRRVRLTATDGFSWMWQQRYSIRLSHPVLGPGSVPPAVSETPD
jgi:hypothetical protein